MATITIVGNLKDVPELRFTAQGKAVANFVVAESKRVKDGNEWKDGPTTWWSCSIWDAQAENAAESLVKGQRVVVVGEVAQRSFETSSGERRSVFEVSATEVAASLKWATVKAEKTTGNGPRRDSATRTPEPAVDDPWGTAPAFGGDSEEPPF